MSLFDTQQPYILFNNDPNVAYLDSPAGAGSEFGQADYSELNELHSNFPLGWNHVQPPMGAEFDDWAAGGGGADWLDGQIGDDVLYGGTGFNLTNNPDAAPGQDYYDLGQITYPGTEIPVIHSIASYDFSSDTLFGNVGRDVLFGQAGHDVLDGGEGDDLMYGGTQGDTMYGGAASGGAQGLGQDTMWGERGHDSMMGGNEYSWLWVGTHYINVAGDYMDGGKGCDTMYGNDGADTMFGRENADLMFGNADGDYMEGNKGHDTMYGGDEYSPYYCWYDGYGDDMYGGAGNDWMFGENGDDYMEGNEGNDHMDGGNDDDIMHGQDGYDTMYGGNGCDYMTGGMQSDVMYGGNDHDTMYGNEGHDYMEGNAGHDDMFGNTGNDVMYGNDGEDLMCGNEDNDWMDGGNDSDRMGGGTGNDTMYGGNEAEGTGSYYWQGQYVGWHPLGDTMNGGEGRDYIDGQGGDDMLFGGTGVDTILGGTGSDTINTGEGGTAYDWEVVDLGDDDQGDTLVYEFSFAYGDEEDGNTAQGVDGYVYVTNFNVGDTLLLCNVGETISDEGCDDCDDAQYNLITNLIDPNADGQHAVVVKDNGQDTLIFFDDTTTPEDPSDPQILKNEAIWLEGVTGVGTQWGQFQDLFSLKEAGYNVVVHNGECPDFIVCEEDDRIPDESFA